MSPRRWIALAAPIVVAVIIALVLRRGSGSDPSPGFPPIVVLSLDTLRADRVSTYGYPRPTTPTLDAFAAEAVCFRDARCQSVGTLTSHLSLFTSLRPPQFRITRIDGENDSQSGTNLRLSEEVPTLAEILRAHGYDTVAYTGGGFVAARYGFDRGFDLFDADRHFGGLPEILQKLGAFLEARAGAGPDPAGKGERPLFLFVHTYDIHQPYDAPAPFSRVFSGKTFAEFEESLGYPPVPKLLRRFLDRLGPAELATVTGLYDNGVRATDDHVAALLELLRRHGLHEDAITVVLSDHGEEFVEHGGFGHGKTVYEELVRVPLLMRLPGGRQGGRVLDPPVALLDVAPTVLELAGLPVPTHYEGRSLAGIIAGTDDGRALFERAIYFDSPDLAPGVRGMQRGRWKVIQDAIRQRVELYDLARDPRERRDRAAEAAPVRDRLSSELTRWVGRMEESGRARGWFSRSQESGEASGEVREQLRALGYVD